MNEWLLERDGCGWALVAGSALGICGSFVGIGFLYAVRFCALTIDFCFVWLGGSWANRRCSGGRRRGGTLSATQSPPAPPPLQFWAPSASCSLNIWFITSIILMFLLYGAISVSPLRPDSAGLFTSAAVLTCGRLPAPRQGGGGL